MQCDITLLGGESFADWESEHIPMSELLCVCACACVRVCVCECASKASERMTS
jgi:hypothetical protein